MSQKRALITGITGQDGSYLAELLLEKGYEVFGLVRRSSTVNFERIGHLQDKIELISGDLLDQKSLVSALQAARPQEVYNLGAQSFVPVSWEQPMLTGEVTGLGVTRLLEAHPAPATRTFAFTKPAPVSCSARHRKRRRMSKRRSIRVRPTGCPSSTHIGSLSTTAKATACLPASGILFNHESPRRGREFVTRKITHGVARIKHGLDQELRLGNLDSRRDWGHAGDFVRAMWMMLQQDDPDDYVIATGTSRTIREFCEIAFAHVGLDWRQYVVVDERFLRPAEVHTLLGDATKAREKLGWAPEVGFEEMVQQMVDSDLEQVAHQRR